MPITILIVEDEIVVAMSLQRSLTKLGYAPLKDTATTFSEALDMANFHRPSLILMDIRLQGGSGIEAARRIKNKHSVPIIFLTAYSDPQTVQSAMVVQPSGFLIKPVAEAQLRIQIEMALYNHQLGTLQ